MKQRQKMNATKKSKRNIYTRCVLVTKTETETDISFLFHFLKVTDNFYTDKVGYCYVWHVYNLFRSKLINNLG